MRTLRLTATLFSAFLALSAAAMILNLMAVNAAAKTYDDSQFWILALVLAFAAYNTARTITTITEKR